MELARIVADIIGRCAEPLIGLRHVHIYSLDAGQSVYWCGLCETICGESTPDDIIMHVATRRHRINYMKLNYLSYYDIVQCKPDDISLLVDYSRTIEADEGRHNVRMCDGPIPAIVLQAYQAAQQADAPSDPARAEPIFLGDSSIGEVLHKIAIKADMKTVGDLLRPLIPTLVTNEEEAAKALEVANRLTRALLEYRLSTSPKQ